MFREHYSDTIEDDILQAIRQINKPRLYLMDISELIESRGRTCPPRTVSRILRMFDVEIRKDRKSRYISLTKEQVQCLK